MTEFAQQVGISLGLLVLCLAGPVATLCVLYHRKSRMRRQRRSPIGTALLRSPGYSVREQLEQAQRDLTFDAVLLTVIPLLLTALFLAQGLLLGASRMAPIAPVYALMAIAFIAYMLRKLRKADAQLDQFKAGYDGELAAGQELDQLMRQGAATFHDLPADGFNIDHVVVAAEGVFAIETKGFTKPNLGRGKADARVVYDGATLRFPTRSTAEPLEQAERQAAWLAKWLSSAVGSPVSVVPVVALPGWFVEHTGRGRVRVFSGKELAGLLKSRGTQAMPAQDVQRIAHQIEQRCRTVEATYSRDRRGL